MLAKIWPNILLGFNGIIVENTTAVPQKVTHSYLMTQQFWRRYILKKTEAYTHTETYPQMFMAVLFIIVKKSIC